MCRGVREGGEPIFFNAQEDSEYIPDKIQGLGRPISGIFLRPWLLPGGWCHILDIIRVIKPELYIQENIIPGGRNHLKPPLKRRIPPFDPLFRRYRQKRAHAEFGAKYPFRGEIFYFQVVMPCLYGREGASTVILVPSPYFLGGWVGGIAFKKHKMPQFFPWNTHCTKGSPEGNPR